MLERRVASPGLSITTSSSGSVFLFLKARYYFSALLPLRSEVVELQLKKCGLRSARGGPPLTEHTANHILSYWGGNWSGQSDFRSGPFNPRPFPEHGASFSLIDVHKSSRIITPLNRGLALISRIL